MVQPSEQGATASPVTDAQSSATPSPSPQYETVRHLLYGRPSMVQGVIKHLYALNYAEPNEWSKPMPTKQPHEVMVVLTKKVRVN